MSTHSPSNDTPLATAMKQGMRQLASGVSVIATRDKSGRPYAMTVTSITSVTDEPPALLICLHRQAAVAQVIGVGAIISANILKSDQQSVSDRCAYTPNEEDRFSEGQWQDCELTHVPCLQDGLATFICQVTQCIPYGTHDIVIANISSVKLHDENSEPLIYCRGGYCDLA
ncbi:flavin reductase family protein [Aurantivibrio plasticivorans]